MTVTVNQKSKGRNLHDHSKGHGRRRDAYDYGHSHHPVVAVKRFGTRCLGGMQEKARTFRFGLFFSPQIQVETYDLIKEIAVFYSKSRVLERRMLTWVFDLARAVQSCNADQARNHLQSHASGMIVRQWVTCLI